MLLRIFQVKCQDYDMFFVHSIIEWNEKYASLLAYFKWKDRIMNMFIVHNITE